MAAAAGRPDPAAAADGTVAPLLLRIGEAAEHSGVSARTLRWYEEIGLLVPCGHTSGGARRYSSDDLARIDHIRELQGLLGLDLGEIRDVLTAEDALAELRREYRSDIEAARRREILVEASGINVRLRAVVSSRTALLGEMMTELEEKAALYARRIAELDAGHAGHAGGGPGGTVETGGTADTAGTTGTAQAADS